MDPNDDILKNLKPKNTIPGLQLNFKPPLSLLKKLSKNESQKVLLQATADELNKSNKVDFDGESKLLEITHHLNLINLNDVTEKKNNQDVTMFSSLDMEDNDSDVIDLTHCIIPEDKRKELLKMDLEEKIRQQNETVDEPMICYSPVKGAVDTRHQRSLSPLRPRLPCLLDDYEYFLEQQLFQISEYKKKLNTQKMSGIAKVICFEQPQYPVPKIEFNLYLKDISHIKIFKFDTPSPDEVYLSNLGKTKNKAKFIIP